MIGSFPRVSETFIINQVADLIDRGIEVEVFSFTKGLSSLENISQRFSDYKMSRLVHYLDMPQNKLIRFFAAVYKLLSILLRKPSIFFKVLNFRKYGLTVKSLKLIFWVEPFIGKKFDLVHCHFGTIANKYLVIREIFGFKHKIITTFYGIDVSHIFKVKPRDYYDNLKKHCQSYLVMSDDMKRRVVEYGFSAEQVGVLPISIDVASYPYSERHYSPGQQINLISVGNFVEKKGFDDLLRALAIVKQKTDKDFKCHIVGDGQLKEMIYGLTRELGIGDVVDFKGYMKLEDLITLFTKMHLCLQPSKTSADGDME